MDQVAMERGMRRKWKKQHVEKMLSEKELNTFEFSHLFFRSCFSFVGVQLIVCMYIKKIQAEHNINT